MGKTIKLIDRSRIVADWKCSRLRFWNYEVNGLGIAKNSTSLELFMGTIVHDSLAAIATFTQDGLEVPIDEIATAANQQLQEQLTAAAGSILTIESLEFSQEQGALIEGMIRGFYAHMWPRLMAKYPTILYVEKDFLYPLSEDITMMCKPDLIVESVEGEVVYIEYKTTSTKKESWINSWDTAVQLHSSVKSVEQTLGLAVDYVQIVGLYKGYESYGKQSSPFCYAYKKSGNPPFTQDQIQYEYKAGFKRYPTWTLDGGVKAWVASMPENVLANQFPLTTPIPINNDLVQSFFRQTRLREEEILKAWEDDPEMSQETLDRVFPQSFDQCVPSYGWACPYKKLCHGYVTNPLDEGFVNRQPHHQAEIDQRTENE